MKQTTRKFLRPIEVHEEYGLDLGSLANDRSAKRGIPYHKVGRRVLYKVEDIERYIESSRVRTIDGNN